MKLKVKDKVAIIAPASPQKSGDESLLEQSVQLLRQWGLEVVKIVDTKQQYFYLAGHDEYRQSQLINVLQDPEIKAIFCSRGGYGCARIAHHLFVDTIFPEKFIIGFSDVVTLHLALANQPNIHCIHGPNIATQQILANHAEAKFNQYALFSMLFEAVENTFTLQPIHPYDTAENIISEKITGGCLSLLVTSLGTAHEIETNSKILFIEEVGEAPYKIDRMLTHLRNADKFEGIKALIFGEMKNCNSPNIKLEAVLADLFKDSPFPVYMGLPFGHGRLNFSWHYQQTATINTKTQQVSL